MWVRGRATIQSSQRERKSCMLDRCMRQVHHHLWVCIQSVTRLPWCCWCSAHHHLVIASRFPRATLHRVCKVKRTSHIDVRRGRRGCVEALTHSRSPAVQHGSGFAIIIFFSTYDGEGDANGANWCCVTDAYPQTPQPLNGTRWWWWWIKRISHAYNPRPRPETRRRKKNKSSPHPESSYNRIKQLNNDYQIRSANDSDDD